MPEVIANPLLDVHRQAEAEFASWDQIEIVETFGEPQAEYAAVHKSVGLIDLPQRGVLELVGKDRLSFLGNLVTNKVWEKQAKQGLVQGQGCYAFMLNLKGRVVADMNIIERGDRTLLETDVRLVHAIKALFEKYQFSEDVKFQSRVGELHEIAFHGPDASRLIGASVDRPIGSTEAKVFGIDAIIWRDDAAGVPGLHAIVQSAAARSVWMNAIAAGVRVIGWAAFNAVRIEAGRTIFGIDFDAAPVASAAPGKRDPLQDHSNVGALPAETGQFERAVSVTKGCYLGQEIVARMHARGQVARQVVGVRIDEGDALPLAGTQVFDETQSSQIGLVTSSTISPILSGAAICLAQLKRPYFELGAKLKIPAEGAVRSATVVPLPFVKGTDR